MRAVGTAGVFVGVMVALGGLALVEHRFRRIVPGYSYCPHCRRRVKGGAEFCRHCGRPVSEPPKYDSPVYVPAVYKQRAARPDAELEPERQSSARFPGGWLRRLFRKRFLLPGWLVAPLALLGLFYLVEPWRHDWYSYGFGLFSAAVIGVWVRSRYRVTVLHRTERGAVLWVRWSKKEEDVEEAPPVPITRAR
jgi:zinc-ribbon domain